MWKRLLEFWDLEESLSTFLWLLMAFVFVAAPISQLRPGFDMFFHLCFGVVLVAGIWATIDSPRTACIAAVLVAVSIGSFVVLFMLGTDGPMPLISEICDLPPLSLFLVVIIKQIMKDGPVTTHRVKGGVATYMLIGMIWAKLYSVISLAAPGAFTGATGLNSSLSFLYFSFVTLTTVGYGDILPVNEFARSLANAEALIGQLFPAIFIARLVSLEVESRHRG